MKLTKQFASYSLLALTLLSGHISTFCHADSQRDLALTIYSSADPSSFNPQEFINQQLHQGQYYAAQVPGFGVVKEIRQFKLNPGINEIKLIDVAQFIDPTSVSFADLTDPSTTVFEQNFQFDLVNPDKLLNKFIDSNITVAVQKGDKTEMLTGKLLSTSPSSLIIQTSQGVEILSRQSPQLKLDKLPSELITKPTLVLKVASKVAGQHTLRSTYQTEGITWRSDYNLILDHGDKLADLNAWVTIMNLSGASYPNTSLKLVAGHVQRFSTQFSNQGLGKNVMRSVMEDAAAPQNFSEKSFFEYHLYTLPRKTDVQMNSTQQLTLFPSAKDIAVDKILVYYGLSEADSLIYSGVPNFDRELGNNSNHKLDIYLKIANQEKNKLGMPMPAGKIRVFKQDQADGNLEFIGEDIIDHTAKDEKLLIKLGQAFDVVGERTQTNYYVDTAKKQLSESIKILIKNHKDQPQAVTIKESLFRWLNWQITDKSDNFEKLDAKTIHFNVDVPANGEKTVSYTVKYTW